MKRLIFIFLLIPCLVFGQGREKSIEFRDSIYSTDGNTTITSTRYKGDTADFQIYENLDVLFDNVKYIDLDTNLDNPTQRPGRFYWDSTLKVPKIDLTGEVTLNMGRELFVYGINRSSRTMVSGDVVYVSPADNSGVAVLKLSIADDIDKAEATVAVVTETIPQGRKGNCTKFGAVNMDLTGFGTNDKAYLSPYDSGLVVPNSPSSPYYKVPIGRILKSGVNGILGVDVRGFTGNDTEVAIDGIFNGIILEKQSISDTVIGPVLYFETDNELRDTMDLPYMYNKHIYKINTTSNTGTGGKARIALNYGTESTPQSNYIYIDHNGGDAQLAVNTTAFPDDGVRLAECGVYDSATHSDYGFAYFQRFNNAVDGSNTDGWINRSAKRIRLNGSKYETGIDPTVSIIVSAGLDSLNVYTTSGIVWQFNRQVFDAQTEKKYYWFNCPSGGKWITDLSQIDSTSDGESLRGVNRKYGLNIFGVQNSGGFTDFFLVSSPSGYYADNDNAINDVTNYAITTVPSQWSKTAVRLFRIVVNYTTTNGGTITNLLGTGGYQDERGQLLGIGGGGGGSGGSVSWPVSDAQFSLSDNSDPTKIMNFQLSGITTGTTRTLTIPDKSGVLLTANDTNQLRLDIDSKLDSAGVVSISKQAAMDTVLSELTTDYNIPYYLSGLLTDNSFFWFNGTNLSTNSGFVFQIANNGFFNNAGIYSFKYSGTNHWLFSPDSIYDESGDRVAMYSEIGSGDGGLTSIPYYQGTDTNRVFNGTLIDLNWNNATYRYYEASSDITLTANADSAKGTTTATLALNCKGNNFDDGVFYNVGSTAIDTASDKINLIIFNYHYVNSTYGSFNYAVQRVITNDTTAPVLLSAEIGALYDSVVVLTFSEAVFFTDTAGTTVDTNGAEIPIYSVTNSGTTTPHLNLIQDVTESDVVTFSYDGSGTIRDLNGNNLPALADTSVTNTVQAFLIPSDFVRYYPLDGNAVDANLSGDDGTIVNAVPDTGVNGNLNTAYYFNGTDARIHFPGTFLNGDTAVTLSFWFKNDSIETQSPGLCISIGAENFGIRLQVASGDMAGYVKSSSDISLNTNTVEGTWYNVIMTWSSGGGGASVYLNNTFIETFAVTAGAISNINDVFNLGSNDQITWLKGSIDNVVFYDRVVTAGERATLSTVTNYE